MVYPYISRIIMDYLANWSSNFAGCLWQTILVFLIALLVGSIVLMIVLRWNPIQWFGWVLVVVSVIGLINTGVYGLNEHAGPISEDVRLEINDYSVGSLERAAHYYLGEANKYAAEVSRNSDGTVRFPEFDQLAKQAADGFTVLSYERTIPIFTGTTVPVKELTWTGFFKGKTGITVGLTGESAVNPKVPAVGIPYAICHEMSHRMCVYSCSDANFGAYLACTDNPAAEFRYSGYLMAFRECYRALLSIKTSLGQDALNRVLAEADDRVMEDMAAYDSFIGEDSQDDQLCKMLVSWHIQELAEYMDPEDTDIVFDPMDESDERFQDILNPTEDEG